MSKNFVFLATTGQTLTRAENLDGDWQVETRIQEKRATCLAADPLISNRVYAGTQADGVLVITMFDDDSVFDAMQAGARGYLLKGADPEETIRAIQAVASGEAIFSPKVAERLITYFGKHKVSDSQPVFPELTPRESEILELIAQGLTNSAIAEQLVLSQKTVRNHVSNIFGKLQVSDRAQAIIRARQAGLGDDK